MDPSLILTVVIFMALVAIAYIRKGRKPVPPLFAVGYFMSFGILTAHAAISLGLDPLLQAFLLLGAMLFGAYWFAEYRERFGQ